MNSTGIVAATAGGTGGYETIVWLWNWLAVKRGAPEMPQGTGLLLAGMVATVCAALGHALEECYRRSMGNG